MRGARAGRRSARAARASWPTAEGRARPPDAGFAGRVRRGACRVRHARGVAPLGRAARAGCGSARASGPTAVGRAGPPGAGFAGRVRRGACRERHARGGACAGFGGPRQGGMRGARAGRRSASVARASWPTAVGRAGPPDAGFAGRVRRGACRERHARGGACGRVGGPRQGGMRGARAGRRSAGSARASWPTAAGRAGPPGAGFAGRVRRGARRERHARGGAQPAGAQGAAMRSR